MFRLSFKRAVLALLMVGLVPHLAVAEIKQEVLTPEGFPTTWKPMDFAIGKEIISGSMPRPARTGTMDMAVSATSPTFKMPVNTAPVDGMGVLKLGTGGEAPDVWQKSGRAEAEAGLGRATAQGVASPALREGWRRVLLSEALPPVVADKGVRPSWLAVRASTLQKLGLYEASWGLWRGVPKEALNDDNVALGWVQAKLLVGQGQEGCAMAKLRTLAGQANGDWPVVMAVCQLLGTGPNPAAASLSLQLVEPVLRAKNPPLLRILHAVEDGKPVTTLNTPQAQVDALGGAVLAAYPALVGPEILPRLPDVALRRLTASDALPVELRGRAAIALARQTGLVADGQAAWKLVSDTTFSGVLPDAVIVARGMAGISGSDAVDYVQAALRLGMVDAAVKVLPKWETVSGSNAVFNATQNRVRMQAILATAILQGKVEDKLWDAWVLAQALDNQAGVRNAQRTLLVVEGLGIGVPARIWQQMHDRAIPVSTLVDPAWQRLLAAAVGNGDIPTSLGLISEAWAGQPPAGVVPVEMGASIEALRRLGLDDVARRVAVEAMLGIPASHLIPLVPEGPPEAQAAPEQVLIGADAGVSKSVATSGTVPAMLPPPRVAPVVKMPFRKPIVPTVRKPTKPVAPKVGG